MNKEEAYHKRMVETNVAALVIKLGIPTTVSMLITNIYNLVDTYFVGTLGVAQQGATGILFTLQAIIQAFAFMLGHGSGTNAAKFLATSDKKTASTYVSNAFYLGFVIGLILMAFGLIFLEPFMLFLGSSETILPHAKDYGFWVLVSGPFLVTSLILNNNLRYEGKANLAMVGIAAGAVLNILGDYVFINVMGLGVFGAGMSTAISQIISFFILFFFFLRYSQCSLRIKNIVFKFPIFLAIFKAGFPSLLRQGLSSLSGGVLNNLTKPFGDAAVAAISVVNRYSNFVMCVGMGIGQGLQPVAAYNYATEHYDRVKKGLIFTISFSSIVVLTLSVISLIIPSTIVSWFNQNSEVIELGTIALRYSAISLIFTPLSVVMNMALQSVRKSGPASFLSALRSGLAFVPVIFLLVYGFNLGYNGIALSQPIADVLTFLITLPFFFLFLRELNNKEKAKNEPKN